MGVITIEQKRTLFDRKEKGIPEAGFVLDWILFLQLMLLGYNERMKSLLLITLKGKNTRV